MIGLAKSYEIMMIQNRTILRAVTGFVEIYKSPDSGWVFLWRFYD